MPYNIPSHIFDIDEATAERLANRIILKQRRKTLLGMGMMLMTIAIGAVIGVAV